MSISVHHRSKRFLQKIGGVNPFQGDCLPSRVPLFASGRPTLPFPHTWNIQEPIRILETFFHGTEDLTGPGKHNRYFDVVGFPTALVTRDPGVIRAVLSATGDKPGQFERDPLPAEGIARATGKKTLLYANGSLWREQKKLAAPPFSRSKLFKPERFHEFEQTFRKTAAERIGALRDRQQATGEPITRLKIEPEISVVMLEMLVNNFFGGEVEYEELRDRFVPAILMLIEDMINNTLPQALRIPPLFSRRDPALVQARADFEALTDIALSGRASGLGLWSHFKSDLPDEALRSNVRVFLAGALEATTSFASWTLSHLSRRPDIQQQIYDEVKSMDVYNPHHLAQAETLRRTLEETLRLTPALYFLPRRATSDTWIETVDHRKMFIPRGTHVVLDVWHANRCEDFWGETATGYPAKDFAPERWSVIAERGHAPKDFLHFGFGYGPRVCPGVSLGWLEVGLVVGAFVKIFKFKAVNETTGARAGVSTKPEDEVLVDLELRQATAPTRLQEPRSCPYRMPPVQKMASACPYSQRQAVHANS